MNSKQIRENAKSEIMNLIVSVFEGRLNGAFNDAEANGVEGDPDEFINFVCYRLGIYGDGHVFDEIRGILTDMIAQEKEQQA